MAMFMNRGRSSLVRVLSAFPSKDLLVPVSADELSTYTPQSGLTGQSGDLTRLTGQPDDGSGLAELEADEYLFTEQRQDYSLVKISREELPRVKHVFLTLTCAQIFSFLI